MDLGGIWGLKHAKHAKIWMWRIKASETPEPKTEIRQSGRKGCGNTLADVTITEELSSLLPEAVGLPCGDSYSHINQSRAKGLQRVSGVLQSGESLTNGDLLFWEGGKG